MPRPLRKQSPHGAKAIAIDQKRIIARYCWFLFIAIILAGLLALELHVIFGR